MLFLYYVYISFSLLKWTNEEKTAINSKAMFKSEKNMLYLKMSFLNKVNVLSTFLDIKIEKW